MPGRPDTELQRQYERGEIAPDNIDNARTKIAAEAVREGVADAYDEVAAVRDLSSHTPTAGDLRNPERPSEYADALDAINERILESIWNGAGVPEAYAHDRDILERRINALAAYWRTGIF